MNKVILMGRTTKEPGIRYSSGSNSMCIANLTLAVDRRYKRDGQPEADFFNCTAYGKTAEFVEKYVTKGTKLVIVGNIQNDNYEVDHVKHYSVKINVDEIEFAESKNAQNGGQSNPKPETDNDGFMNIPTGIDDEMPFA